MWMIRHLSVATALLVATMSCPPVWAQAPTDTVVRQGTITDDVYAAGPRVALDASVTGDIVAAAGNLTFGGSATGDVIVTAGHLESTGQVGGNLLAAGGWVSIDGPIKGKVIAGGGRVQLDRAARVADDVSVLAGSAELAGEVGGTVRAAAGHLLVLGIIQGNLESLSGDLEIGPGARVGGRVLHRGPQPPRIAEGAVVTGGIHYEAAEVPSPPATVTPAAIGALSTLLAFLGLLLLGSVAHALFPLFTERAGQAVRFHPWSSLGQGFAILVAGPVALVLLMATVLGLPLAFAGLLLYLLALLLGMVVSAFALAGWASRQWPHLVPAGRGRRAVPFALALAALLLLGWLPVVGGLMVFLALVMGIGGAARGLFRSNEPLHA